MSTNYEAPGLCGHHKQRNYSASVLYTHKRPNLSLSNRRMFRTRPTWPSSPVKLFNYQPVHPKIVQHKSVSILPISRHMSLVSFNSRKDNKKHQLVAQRNDGHTASRPQPIQSSRQEELVDIKASILASIPMAPQTRLSFPIPKQILPKATPNT